MNNLNNQTPDTTPHTIDPATIEAAARYQARKTKRLATKRARRNSPARKAAQQRRAASAADANRHYMANTDDLMTGAIVTRM